MDTANRSTAAGGKNGGFFSRLNPLRRRRLPPIPEEREVTPEYTAGFFSQLVFAWMSSIMHIGYQRPLQLNDIWLLNPRRNTRDLATKLKASFLENHKKGLKKPLVRAIYQTIKTDFLVGGAASLLATIFQALVPFIIKYIIAFAVRDYYARQLGLPSPYIGEGVGWVVGVTIMQILISFGNNHFFYRSMLVGGQVRSALISIIFDKAMTISGRAKAGGHKMESTPPGTAPGSEEEKASFKAQLDEKAGDQGATKSQGWDNGRIVNLMSVDTFRVDQAAGWFHMSWTSPLALIVTIILLLVNLTYSALPGIALFFLTVPMMGIFVASMLKTRRKVNQITDQRVTVTQEVLQSIRFIKYYAWETDFLRKLGDVRRREITTIRVMLALRNGLQALGGAVPIFASMLAFIVYNLTKHPLDPAPVFSSLALFNQLRMPLMFLPMILGLIADALQSLERIEEFLLCEDSPESAKEDPALDSGFAVEMEAAAFTWEQSSPPPDAEKEVKAAAAKASAALEKAAGGGMGGKKPKGKKAAKGKEPAQQEPEKTSEESEPPFVLPAINLKVKKSELLAIVGGVGSGKSSLLSAIAGEMRQTGGDLSMHGSRAFCTQMPWIQNATLQENVAFGCEFSKAKFDSVVDACALVHDLEILPHGANTEIGERGINLSGGQKHRVSLARAIYFDADIVLLDDPLTAVDAHVGAHIMDHAICGLLKGKCRILATHQLHVLPRCDRIALMDNGRIVACDTFSNLMSQNQTFQKMMENVQFDNNQTTSDMAVEKAGTDSSDAEDTEELKRAPDVLMQEEDRQVDSISWAVYGDYWRSTGSPLVLPLLLLTLAMAQGSNVVTNLWLAWWSANQYNLSDGTYIGIYAALGVIQAVLVFGSGISIAIFVTESSKRMYQRALNRILRAPVSFFDTTPLGRIMNRFSKDVDVMDNNLPEAWRMSALTVASIFSIMILTIVYYYYFAIAVVPLCVFYVFSASYYRASAREIKRHESVLRSTVFARFNEAIIGTATIRAYGVQEAFSHRLVHSIDDMDSAYYLTFANQRWLALRLDAIGFVFVFVSGMLVVTNKFSVPPSISGLVLSYLISITQFLQLTVRQLTEVENHMNAAERMHYYGRELPQEPPADTTVVKLPSTWPERGLIKFNNVHMRYRDGLPLVLQGLDLTVQPGERLGIVGRTGAGKSSILVALFRMTELTSGSIEIDDINITSLGIKDLRGRLAIIPQDPTLFRGTVRSNLDPFDEHTDLDLWSALRQAHLIDENSDGNTTPKSAADAIVEPVEEIDAPENDSGNDTAQKTNRITLDTKVEADGSNFSLGQRQLMGLARALVRNSRIIVCDEATSSIDFESDRKVQATIASGFKGKTLLCIAHRLKTIVGYDRVCVIEEGRVAEIDSPLALFDREGGRFRAMCERSQIGREEILAAQSSDGLVDLGREKDEAA